MRTAALPSPRTRTSGTSAKYDMSSAGRWRLSIRFFFAGGDFAVSSPRRTQQASPEKRGWVWAAMSRMATPRGESEPMASPQV